MDRKDYLKAMLAGSVGIMGLAGTVGKAFATEPSKGVFNYDDKVIIDGNQIEKNKADIATNAEDIAANALHIGNVDDFQTIFTGDGDKPTNCVDAISQIINSNLIGKTNVFYVDTDYITDEKFASFDDYVVAINNSGEVKPIQKMGFKTFIILKDGKLDKYFMANLINKFDTTFALTSSGWLSWTAPKSTANQYYVCCLSIDANKYNKIKFTFSKTTKEASNTYYPSVIYISTSPVNETKPYNFYNSFPNPNYNVTSSGGAKSGEFDISSYSDTIYLCFGTYSWYGGNSILYSSTFYLYYLELT